MDYKRCVLALLIAAFSQMAQALSPSQHVICCAAQSRDPKTEIPPACRAYDLKKEACESVLKDWSETQRRFIEMQERLADKNKPADQRGLLALSVVVIGLLAFLGWHFWKRKPDKSE